jgi:7-cyano-7-deazaguanine synthase
MSIRKKRVRGRVTVLLSGGIDSSTCLAYYLHERFHVDAVFVDYGHVAAKKELRAAKSICRHFRVPFRVVQLIGVSQKGPGLIVGRNAFLLCTTVLESDAGARTLAIGLHSGTRYRDCSPLFVRELQNVFDICTGGTIQIGVPFLKWTKPDVWALAKKMRIPVSLTYSCERGLKQPCGSCDSCSDLEMLRARSQQQD